MQGAFDAYAMGNFPFASDYMVGEGQGELPAWPMRVACQHMSSLAPSAATSPASSSAAAARSGSAEGTNALDSHQAAGFSYRNRAVRWLQQKLWVGTSSSSSVSKHLGRKHGRGSEGVAQHTAQPDSVKKVRSSHMYSGVQQDTGLLDRLASASGLLYNASGTASCYSLDLAGPAAGSVGAWDYQVWRCSLLPQCVLC
jgi:hypothetical protein